MAGKKDKKQKKKNKSLSHIGSALFPRAMFSAVPRSPEPPKPARSRSASPSLKLTRGRSPSPLSTAILDAAMVGRAVATPSPNSTLRTTGNLTLPPTLPTVPGREELDVHPLAESSSMARSSMYDYDDSDAEDEEEDDDDHLDYMNHVSKVDEQMEYHDDPGYARVEEIQEMMAQEKRGTISNRGRLDTPDHSHADDSPLPSHRTGATTNRSELDLPGKDQPELAGSSRAEVHHHQPISPQDQDDDQPLEGRSGKKKKKKKGKKKKGQEEEEVKDLYAKPVRKDSPQRRASPTPSNDSDLTGVTNPTADDFSDLISPPPPWKRKAQQPDVGTPEVLSGRSSKKSPKSRAKQIIEEPVIVRVTTDNKQFASAPSLLDNDVYSHLNHTATLNKPSNEDSLLRTIGRLKGDLQLIEKERDDLTVTLDHRTRQLMEEKTRSSGLQRQLAQGSKSRQADLNNTLSRMADLEAEVSELNAACEQGQKDKRSLQEVNKRLRAENQSLRDTIDTNQDDDGEYLRQLKSQAEMVIQENDELKNVIHKLNVQLSRYQAKYDPPTKGDPPGLPTRGATPRWLTDTTYLSPLIKAYEVQLEEKEAGLRGHLDDMEELRRSAEGVMKENQRLHRRLEETGGGRTRSSDGWLSEMEEQAKLVLEENQVVMEQVDLQQKKLQDQHRKHMQETIRLTQRLALVEEEKAAVENVVSELEIKYGALSDRHQRTLKEKESQMPVNEHMDAIAELKRNMEDLKRKNEAEMENTLSKVTAVESEKTILAMRIADSNAENSQLKGEIHALHKTQKQLQHKMTMIEKELTHSRGKENAANQHLTRVLEIAEQTAAERDSYKKMAHSQAQEKERAVNKMMAGNVTLGRMEEKLKTYRMRAEQKVGDVVGRMKDQEQVHTSRLTQYEREIQHLSHLVKEKQDALDHVAADKQRVEDQLEVVWQSATEDNKRLKSKLAKSLKSSFSADSTHLLPYGSDSDNRGGFMSSESD